MNVDTYRRALFFYGHAGYSYDPSRETASAGRWRGAVELARAELHADRAQWETIWADDWDIGMSHADYYCAEAYPDGEPRTCESAELVDRDGRTLACLGCIDDADEDYRRVIAAELAHEAMRAGAR